MTKEYVKTKITFAHNYIFLLKIGQSLLKDNIFHGVYIFGKSDLSNMFTYTLQIEGPEGSLKKIYKVKSQEEGTTNGTKISSLLTILGNLNDIIVKISLELKKETCIQCKQTFDPSSVYLDKKETYCKHCKPGIDMSSLEITKKDKIAVISCAYQPKGCTYNSSITNNVMKHERWFCEYSNAACKWGCNKNLISESRLKHYITNYVKAFVYSENNFNFNFNIFNISYENVLYLNSVRFLCQWSLIQDKSYPQYSNFSLNIVSSLSAQEIEPYKCEVKLLKPDKNLICEKVPPKSSWKYKSDYWDFQTGFRSDSSFKVYTLVVKIYKS